MHSQLIKIATSDHHQTWSVARYHYKSIIGQFFLYSSEDSDGDHAGGKKTGILVEITAKIACRALEPCEDIWIVFMAIVKDFHVK